MSELKPGSSGPEVGRWFDYCSKYAASYAFLLGPRDLYYGNAEASFTRELQRRLKVPITGRFGDREAGLIGYRWTGTTTPPPVPQHRPIWVYSAPGSGATGPVGPSFQLGERMRLVLNINHVWLNYPMGGYLGFMGGDPTYSYNDVIGFEAAELERQIAACPDLDNPTLEIWLSGYSQSADGMMVAVNRLFGDGGRFEKLRSRINGLILFGNPATPVTGIARRTFPEWLNRLTRNINYGNDFYAVAPDKIRPAMYAIIVEAEMELPFFVHVMKIAIKVIPKWLPIFGGILGPLGPVVISGLAGISSLSGSLGGLLGQASGADEQVDRDLEAMLSLEGLITGLPDIIGLIGALPGLQAHGGYEFDPVMMDRAYDIVAGFRR